MLPDYQGRGLVNLIASIVEGCGGRPRHAPLAKLPAREVAAATNMVLFVIDGLGDNYLMRQARGELARRRRAAITSVFPSTTASAITTSYTGCTPLEHGLTGWFTYFGEAGASRRHCRFVRAATTSRCATEACRRKVRSPRSHISLRSAGAPSW